CYRRLQNAYVEQRRRSERPHGIGPVRSRTASREPGEPDDRPRRRHSLENRARGSQMRPMRRRAVLLVPFALAGTAAAVAQQSQEPISALKGHNANAPIDVASDRLEVQDRADRAVFVGNVHVKQAELTLDTARLSVAYSSGQGVQIQRLDASGGVTVRSPSETATG